MSTSGRCGSKMWELKNWEAQEFKKWGLEPSSHIEVYACVFEYQNFVLDYPVTFWVKVDSIVKMMFQYCFVIIRRVGISLHNM